MTAAAAPASSKRTTIARATLLAAALVAAFTTPASSGVLDESRPGAGRGTAPQAFPLRPLEGHTQSEAFAINNAGEVAGWSFGSAPMIAVIWDSEGNPTALAPLPGDDASQAEDINNAGTVVGRSLGPGEAQRAVMWGPDRRPVGLPHLPGHTRSRARAINEDGVVVGQGWVDGVGRAVMWRSDGTTIELSRLPGDPESDALGINAVGVVVGKSQGPRDPETGSRKRTAMVWSPDGRGTALAPSPGQTDGVAIAINDAGIAVGESIRTITDEDGCVHFFTGMIWNRDGRSRVLPPLADGVDGFPAFGCVVKGSHAAGITSSGTVVGLSATGSQAVRWDPDGEPVALPPLPGGTFSWAHGVNEAGLAVGFSEENSRRTAVVWR